MTVSILALKVVVFAIFGMLGLPLFPNEAWLASLARLQPWYGHPDYHARYGAQVVGTRGMGGGARGRLVGVHRGTGPGPCFPWF